MLEVAAKVVEKRLREVRMEMVKFFINRKFYLKEVAGFGKGKCELRRVFSAAAGAFGFSSTLAINQRGNELDDFSCLKFWEELWGDGGEKSDRSVGDSSKDEDAVEVTFEGLGDGLEGIGIGMAEMSDDGWRAVNRFDFGE